MSSSVLTKRRFSALEESPVHNERQQLQWQETACPPRRISFLNNASAAASAAGSASHDSADRSSDINNNSSSSSSSGKKNEGSSSPLMLADFERLVLQSNAVLAQLDAQMAASYVPSVAVADDGGDEKKKQDDDDDDDDDMYQRHHVKRRMTSRPVRFNRLKRRADMMDVGGDDSDSATEPASSSARLSSASSSSSSSSSSSAAAKPKFSAPARIVNGEDTPANKRVCRPHNQRNSDTADEVVSAAHYAQRNVGAELGLSDYDAFLSGSLHISDSAVDDGDSENKINVRNSSIDRNNDDDDERKEESGVGKKKLKQQATTTMTTKRVVHPQWSDGAELLTTDDRDNSIELTSSSPLTSKNNKKRENADVEDALAEAKNKYVATSFHSDTAEDVLTALLARIRAARANPAKRSKRSYKESEVKYALRRLEEHLRNEFSVGLHRALREQYDSFAAVSEVMYDRSVGRSSMVDDSRPSYYN